MCVYSVYISVCRLVCVEYTYEYVVHCYIAAEDHVLHGRV